MTKVETRSGPPAALSLHKGNIFRGILASLLLGSLWVLNGALPTQAYGQSTAAAEPARPQSGVNGPDQAHAMLDVEYHFANLWFAAEAKNWELAAFYLDKTRAHLQWAVQLQPTRKTKAGTEINLNGILEALTNSLLQNLGTAIEHKDAAGFQQTYHQTLAGCYACHVACERPFLRMDVPRAPSPLVQFSPNEPLPQGYAQMGPAARGKIFFQQNCALCHADTLGPRNVAIGGQGPSLVGIVGRRAASEPDFNYTKALTDAKLVWTPAALEHFLLSPTAAVPGTTMLVSVPSAESRSDLIAYLSTLKAPSGIASSPETLPSAARGPDLNDWRHAAPGVNHHFTAADLPAPYSTRSAGNGPRVVGRPADARLSVPPHFTVREFVGGLSGPRLIRGAPNGDIFIAETGARCIHVLRAADGADAPSENQIFAEHMDRPFGIAFYPPGKNPEWMYVANNNSVVRFPYRNGDLRARGAAEIIVPRLTGSTGGHSTRDVAFSRDGRRLFISVGSGSNVAEGMGRKTVDEIRAWEAEHVLGAAWGSESNRADILVTDPEGHEPVHAFATGIRNGVGLAVNPTTGVLWTSTNERDGLGDDLVPDYITRVKEGGFYGWPWYYMGGHEDPRHAGERPDLAGRVIVPDVLVQSHSASLEMTFYPANAGVAAFPKEYDGDAFAAFHGSWNRHARTGYKVVRVRVHDGVPTGEYEDFLTGFVVDDASVWGRPVGVAVAHDGALLVSEDGNGVVWRVSYSGK